MVTDGLAPISILNRNKKGRSFRNVLYMFDLWYRLFCSQNLPFNTAVFLVAGIVGATPGTSRSFFTI